MKSIFLCLILLGLFTNSFGKQRDIKLLEDTATSFRFSSEEEGDGVKNRLKFEFSSESGTLDTTVRVQKVTDDTKDKKMFEIRWAGVIEYTENGAAAGYQKGEEVTTVNFGDDTTVWNNISCTNPGANWDCEVQSQDGQYKFVVHIVANVTAVGGVPIKPTSTKLDVFVNKASRTPNTRIALFFRTKATDKQAIAQQSDEQKSGFSNFTEKQITLESGGFFSWMTHATLNGQPVDILNSELIADSSDGSFHSNKVYFAFDSVDAGPIVWDPKIDLPDSGSSLLPSLFLILIGLFIIAY